MREANNLRTRGSPAAQHSVPKLDDGGRRQMRLVVEPLVFGAYAQDYWFVKPAVNGGRK